MHIVKTTFTTTLCVLFFSLSSTAQSAPKKISKPSNNDEIDFQQAYQELVLKYTQQKHPPRSLKAQKKRSIASQKKLKTHAINIAKQQLKIPYQLGGKTPTKGFDCSGLIQYSFQKANISLPRTAASQYKKTKRISLAQLQTGDLIFFHTLRRKHTNITHVGLYLGNNKFIHAPRSGKVVSIVNFSRYWKRKMVGAGRV